MKDNKKIRTTDLAKFKLEGRKISMLTAYEYTVASLLDEAGVDVILVGDSLGMTVLGYETTIPVTMEDMIHHTKAVSRGVKNALVIADMPFLSYQEGEVQALRNAGRFLKETGAEAVKLEGGSEVLPQIKTLIASGIPVCGHLGLTPQSFHQLGGFKVQGREVEKAEKIINDAKLLEDSGVFALILECIPTELAKKISQSLSIPCIGIGAGSSCDGQVLVFHDAFGLSTKKLPKFVRTYDNLKERIKDGVLRYKSDIQSQSFPSDEESY